MSDTTKWKLPDGAMEKLLYSCKKCGMEPLRYKESCPVCSGDVIRAKA